MKRRSALLALIAIAGLFSAGFLSASANGGISILLPPSAELRGKVNPSTLPRTTAKPITLSLEGRISELGSGARPPALKTLSLQFDKNGAIFTKGLETCKWGPISELSIVQVCRKALVGHGDIEIDVEVPEQPAFHTEAPMLIYNGRPQSGRPVLIYYVYAHVPAPTTFLTSGVIEKAHGKFGTQTTIPIPTFVGHNGSLTGFRAEIGKSWRYKGKKVSLLTAHCQRGSLLLHNEFDLISGDNIDGEIIQKCD